MKVNPQAFFGFCAGHVPLLRALGGRAGEISDADVQRLIQSHAGAATELPRTTWQRLLEYQILVPSEPGSPFYLLADPVGRLLAYLFDEANPATPEMIRGYIASLEALSRKLGRALEEENVTVVELSFREINDTLRRIYADLDETHHCILQEVARFKTTQRQVSVRDKFRRIVHWMERFVEPMIDIVRADGPMRSSFDDIEQLLRRAREQALFNDHPALDRNLRYLRLVRKHALRVFEQCRKEIQPLYESLRRSSFIAEGAALALQRLMSEGLANWGTEPLIGVYQMRIQNVPSDQAIELALRRLAEHPPEPAPRPMIDASLEAPPAMLRRQWLDSLPERAASELPIDDLLQWLQERHPNKNTHELLAGFTALLFHDGFEGQFRDGAPRSYATVDGRLEGSPLRLSHLAS
ncbi:MAG: hypothetical protein HYR88_14630 [Verrucomicrobia bacterium]|nr:hypothetical protein [Verrucomicrobiota bacterium]